MSDRKSVFDRCMRAFLGVILIVMVICTFWQVFCRYVIGDSLAWSEELARYLQIWMTFIGAAYAVKYGAHIAMKDLVKILPHKLYIILDLFSDLVIVIVSSLTIWQSRTLIRAGMGQTSPVIGIPMYIIYFGLPLGAALSILFILFKYLKKIRNLKETPAEQ